MQHDHEQQSRNQLCRVMAAVYGRGWCDGTGGNFSSLLAREPLQLLMAPSGVHKGEVSPEQLIVVDGAGAVVRGTGRASAETLLHLAIVQQTGAGAVLHSHSQAATLLSQRIGREQPCELLLEGLEMLKGLVGITTHTTGVALPVLPNDQNLARLSDAAEPLLPHAPHGLLIAGHGLYAWGCDLTEAHRHLEILEFLLEQRWRELLLEPESLQPQRCEGLDHVLLDIEGTTCPLTFVSEVLFPYAADRLESYLRQHEQDDELQQLLADVRSAWQVDAEATAAGLPFVAGTPVAPYLRWLISVDRKLTALKDLQGLIWSDGYACGALQGPLFADVAPALRRWKRQGLGLSVYSSGSVAAQQLLYGYSQAGDLRGLFEGWFDTRTGAKQEASSYAAIATKLGIPAERVLFISDSNAELHAARTAGMQVLFSHRRGNGQQPEVGFEKIDAFSTLQLSR
jgi:2,3-diketo-5-methylthio-1-phosphopentane phosphatase/methylthioribulose-1-phosphate dehydratase